MKYKRQLMSTMLVLGLLAGTSSAFAADTERASSTKMHFAKNQIKMKAAPYTKTIGKGHHTKSKKVKAV